MKNLDEIVAGEGPTNIESVLTSADASELAAACCDLILLCSICYLIADRLAI